MMINHKRMETNKANMALFIFHFSTYRMDATCRATYGYWIHLWIPVIYYFLPYSSFLLRTLAISFYFISPIYANRLPKFSILRPHFGLLPG